MKVKTDYDGCDYITAGKEYECFLSDFLGYPTILGDDGDEVAIFISKHPECAHLDGVGTWQIIDDSND